MTAAPGVDRQPWESNRRPGPPAPGPGAPLGEGGPKRGYRWVTLGGAGGAAVLGLLALIGWWGGRLELASLGPNYIPMAPSTALALFVLGGALALHAAAPGDRWARVGALAGGLVVALYG